MGKLLHFLLLMTSVYAGHAQKGLECENDMIRNITCTWDGRLQGTDLFVEPQSKCTIVCKSRYYQPDNKINYKCDLKKSDGKIRGCTVHISETLAFSTYSKESYNLNVTCENYTEPVAKLSGYIPRLAKVRLSPPEMPTVENATLSWSIASSKIPKFLKATPKFSFELQQRTEGQTWKDVQSIEVTDTSRLLDEDELVRGQQYWARVRFKPKHKSIPQPEWSAWSPVASWVSTVGRPPATLQQKQELESWLVWWAVVGAVAVLVFLVGIMFLGTRIMKSSLIPNPSKYFDGLDSVHKGNFKAWLGSILTLNAFGVELQSEYTSPVEVIKDQKPCKSFSNNQYFHERQKGAKLLPPPLPLEPLEPCLESSPYNDMKGDVGFGMQNHASMDQESCHSSVTDSSSSTSDGDGSGCRTHMDPRPIQLCASYKDLSRLRAGAQSPDSGVSMASVEEESHEESLEENSQDEKSPLDHPATFSFLKPVRPLNRPGFFLPMTSQPLFLANPCAVPFSGMCLDPVAPDLCSTPTGWSHKQNPLDGMYGELEPSSDDYQPLQAS
ncbi:hypothetical protein ACEWY4_018031 [Coilia grayii]|uniref:Interleukin-2 receptor subunit beta n=1 Tax=Coilia grayii TaxID=363190 RepID=A0ABD1JII4_9TELE